MIQEMRCHIVGKIAQASLEKSPFPHLIIEEFFPSDVYEKILSYNPFVKNVGEEWLSKAASGNVSSRTPYHARKQINFHQNVDIDAPPEEAAFWAELKSCFLDDDWFIDLVKAKYPDYFSLRFGDLAAEPEFASHFRRELFLQRHEPGYYIGPHTDIPTRVFTCIFSFASKPGFEEYGTELLVHKDALVRCWGNDHYTPEGFEIKKVAPYKPNNFLLFFKTRHSFHSVRDINDKVPNQRYGMQFQFYEGRNGVFKDLSAPNIMATAHTVKDNPVSPAMRWKPEKETFLKLSTGMASSLSDAEKVYLAPGDVVESAHHESVGDHIRLENVRVNGRSLASDWYIYAAVFQREHATI